MDFHAIRTIWTAGWSKWRPKSIYNSCCSSNVPMMYALTDAWAVVLDDPMIILTRWKNASTFSIRRQCQLWIIMSKSIWCAMWTVKSHQSWCSKLFDRRSMTMMPIKVLCDTHKYIVIYKESVMAVVVVVVGEWASEWMKDDTSDSWPKGGREDSKHSIKILCTN